jgi:predicted ATPase
MAHFTPASRVMRGWARAVQGGDSVDACVECREGLEEIAAGGARIGVPMFRSLYGEALLLNSAPAEAAGELARARQEALATGEVWWLPETLRLLAEARRAAGAAKEDIAARLDEAVALAEAQGEASLAARARASRDG